MDGRFSGAVAATVLWIGALLALGSGVGIACILLVDPLAPYLGRTIFASAAATAGFGLAGILLVLMRWSDTLTRRAPSYSPPAPAPEPEPAPAASLPEPTRPAPTAADLATQLQTFCNLEMWDLALAKAEQIQRDFSGSPEAAAVAGQIAELRWKAEPKPTPPREPSPAEKRAIEEGDVASLLRHLRTYVDLEMWELAHEKGAALIRAFPDSREAAEAAEILRRTAGKV